MLARLLIFRSLRERPLRMLLSTFGIVLGVASILAIGVTNRAALASVTELFADTSGKSNLIITSAESDASGFNDAVLARAERVPGVGLLAPSIQLTTVLAEEAPPAEIALSFMGMDQGGLSLWGIDPAVDGQVREYELVNGRFLSDLPAADEIVLVDTFAAEQSLAVGGWVEITTPYGIDRLRLVGLIAEQGVGRQNNGAFGVIPLETAQKLFDRPNALDQIDVIAETPDATTTQIDQLKTSLQTALGPDYSVLFPASQSERVVQMLGNYQIGLNFLSGMALFVGAFLIYNAFSMTVIERTREFGMLRTIGMTRRQVIRHVLSEASMLGVIGSALGIGLGILLARGLATILEFVLGQQLDLIQLPLDLIITSAVVGILVTVVAAAVPAWQAGKISPLEALRIRGANEEGWLIRHGWTVGLALLLLSTIILLWNPFPYDAQFRLGSVVVVALFLGGTLIIPASVGYWERGLRLVVRRLYGNSGLLGSLNIQRARMRTTLTVAALMVGVSMMIVVWVMTESFKGDLEAWLEGYIGGDIYVTSSVNMRADMGRRLQSVEGVTAVAPIRYFNVQWAAPDGREEDILFMAVEPAEYSQVTTFVFNNILNDADAAAAMTQLAEGDTVFISSVIAEKYNLQPGDDVQLFTKTGWQPFKIAAVVVDFYNQGMVIDGSWSDMRRHFRLSDANAYMIKVEPGVNVASVKARIEALLGDRYHLIVESNSSIQERISVLLDQAYSMFDVLALISMAVAFMGITNTLTMNVLERIREIGMLRSIGMSQQQVVAMVLAEAGVMGVIGGVIGLVFGIILSRIFLLSMAAMSGYKIAFILPASQVIAGFVVALVVSHLAAMFPASRAARVRILDAIQHE
ncbi:MAG: ABC transporter permease [Ardenticatenaceae bacterium]|nr:ABC transporter permease [Ardenticatenaceae bacterium]